ncbi:MAG: DUF4271 domain-containing protein [Aequorivita sp.]
MNSLLEHQDYFDVPLRQIFKVYYSERLIESTDWATFLLVGCFVLFALAKYLYPKRFEEFLLLPVSDKYFFVHGKDAQITHPFSILLFAVQIICATIFIYLLFQAFNPEAAKNNPWLIVQIFAAYSIFVLVKFSIEKIVANIFSIDAIIDQYLYQKLSYRNFLGIILFLGNLVFLYVVQPTTTSLLVFSVVIVSLNVIIMSYNYKKSGKLVVSNFFHFILYLCALEISPYIILYKSFVP